jgi:adenine deaminase
MTEIYVVRNNIGINRKKIEYVGTDAEKAQEVCDANQSKTSPCFIQVWEDGEGQYVTRILDE